MMLGRLRRLGVGGRRLFRSDLFWMLLWLLNYIYEGKHEDTLLCYFVYDLCGSN